MGELVKILPDIIRYLLFGFLFIKTFRLVYVHKNDKDFFTQSLIVGYVIAQVAQHIPVSIDVFWDNILIGIWSIVIAYVIGRLLNFPGFMKVLEKLKVRKTLHTYLWDDVIDDTWPMKATIDLDGHKYTGMVHLVEEDTDAPHIAISQGSVDNVPMSPNWVAILDASKASSVIIEYDPKSPMAKTIQFK